eukprot:jgi/Psemu1/313673/fgenesh1_kg.1270_\
MHCTLSIRCPRAWDNGGAKSGSTYVEGRRIIASFATPKRYSPSFGNDTNGPFIVL